MFPRWLSALPDKSKRINQIKVPGSHDASSYTINYNVKTVSDRTVFKMFNQVSSVSCFRDITDRWTLTQDCRIRGQLDNGYRAFNLLVSFLEGKYYFSHTFVNESVDVVLNAFVDFLRDNPSEFIIIKCTTDHENKATFFDEVRESFFETVVRTFGSLLYISEGQGQGFPRYSDLLKGQSRIFFFFSPYTYYPGIIDQDIYYLSYWPDTSDVKETLGELKDFLNTVQPNNSTFIEVQFLLTEQVKDVIFGLFSNASLKTLSQEFHKYLDQFLITANVSKASVFLMDFATPEDIKKILLLNW